MDQQVVEEVGVGSKREEGRRGKGRTNSPKEASHETGGSKLDMMDEGGWGEVGRVVDLGVGGMRGEGARERERDGFGKDENRFDVFGDG
jgi:hypothetical protein